MLNLLSFGPIHDQTPSTDMGVSGNSYVFNEAVGRESFVDSLVVNNKSFNNESVNIEETNAAELLNGRFQGKFVSKNVVNLSSRELSASEISLLSKGLKFVPTPRGVNRAILKQELETFGRILRLKWFYRNEVKSDVINPFRPKSNFNPKGKDASIEIYLSRLEDEILSIDTKLKYCNLSREEFTAMNSLRDDPSIIIKSADKGSAVVVWGRDDYLKEADKQLGDKDVYEKVDANISPLIKTIQDHLLKVQINGDLNKQIQSYFINDNPRIGRFYLLPKIHKRLHDVPGRPVISNCNFYTENISAFLDHHLQPLAKAVRSFVKDTNDFLCKLQSVNNITGKSILCTIDVVGLYPNIPHEDGLRALRKHLEARVDKNVSTETLLELAECVLKNNVFEHNGEFYRQKRGTAIGTKMAPPYAVLFMADLEERMLHNATYKPDVWWRYIDDIFMIWEHGERRLLEFLSALNNFHPSIKFTWEYSESQVNFLDVSVFKKDNQLVTDLFVKPTDTHQYLHASSCHVSHSKRSIPYSQCLRLNRICSDTYAFDKRCNELESWLLDRGYSDKLVRKQILKARKVRRNDLLHQVKEKREAPDLVFNITYHPAFSRLKTILSNIHLLLAPNLEHQKVFPNIPVVGFKRGRSLQDILVRAKLRPDSQIIGQCKKCGKKRCKVCDVISETSEFSNKNQKEVFSIRSTLNCNSENVVYLVNCKTCNKQYVGSSEPKFRLRYNNYKSCNRKYVSGANHIPQASFHAHFAQLDHNGMEDWSFILIDQGQNIKTTRRKESFWQHRLGTFAPDGLNEREVAWDNG